MLRAIAGLYAPLAQPLLNGSGSAYADIFGTLASIASAFRQNITAAYTFHFKYEPAP